jgi:hypothetical protein
VDPRTGRVLYTSPTYYGIVVAGAATGTGPGDPILLGQEDRNGDPSVTVISLVANGTVGPAFGGVPVFGTMTPWAVTGAVAVIGLGLLILPGRRQWRRYRAWDDERQAAWWSRSSR